MKRIGRIIFISTTLISLVMFVTTMGLWVRSYFLLDRAAWTCQDVTITSNNLYPYPNDWWTKAVEVGSWRGILAIGHSSIIWPEKGLPTTQPNSHAQWKFRYDAYDSAQWLFEDLRYSTVYKDIPQTRMERLGFGSWYMNDLITRPLDDDSKLYPVQNMGITIPDWSLAVLTAVLPIYQLCIVCRRRTRIKKSLCIFCAYDLRATPERCPECGTVPSKANA